MLKNWDLFILNPILIILSFAAVWFIWKRENESKKWLYFFIETILVWTVNSFLVKLGILRFGITNAYSNPVAIALSLFGVSAIFTMLFKPLATWLTGIVKHRRYWIWASMLSSFIAIILFLIANSSLNDVSGLLIVGSIMIGISLASQSLYFLYINEQKYYRIFPIKATFRTAFLIIIGTFFGSYIFNLTNVSQHSVLGNNETVNYLGAGIVCIIFLIVAFGLSFMNKEKSSFVKSFDFDVKDKLEPYNSKILVLLMLSTLFLGLIYGLIQSPIYEFYIVAKVKNSGASAEVALSFVRKYQDFFIGGQLILGYLGYFKIVKKIGYRQSVIGLIVILAFLAFLMTLIHSYYFLLFVSFVAGLIFFELFYMWFGLAIMWNYRTERIPVTGLVGASTILGSFIPNIILSICRISGVGVFQNYNSLEALANIENVSEILVTLTRAVILMSSIIFALALAYLAFLTFTINQMLVEYVNVEEIHSKLVSIEKRSIANKIKTRMTIN
ncbi:MFS cation transporter [Mesoplasma seiffertii]|uniref:MFS cation transporter n=1 Tax=Mesoplasma seiffertii TaxID=28224 RepID=UPI00047EEBC6|nr:MFS cation transporter [Mesoplasma seiffertii]